MYRHMYSTDGLRQHGHFEDGRFDRNVLLPNDEQQQLKAWLDLQAAYGAMRFVVNYAFKHDWLVWISTKYITALSHSPVGNTQSTWSIQQNWLQMINDSMYSYVSMLNTLWPLQMVCSQSLCCHTENGQSWRRTWTQRGQLLVIIHAVITGPQDARAIVDLGGPCVFKVLF